MVHFDNITLAPCSSSDDALIVAGALGDSITRLRDSLDTRSLFSAQYNKKLIKRIEVLEQVRDDFMEYSRALLQAEKEAIDEEIRSGAPGSSTVFTSVRAPGSRSGGRRS